MPAEGVKLSGAVLRQGLQLDVTLEKPEQIQVPKGQVRMTHNLSGKRTEIEALKGF
jgi:hypothetical protein